MSEEHDVDAPIEAQWDDYRGRLADGIAGLGSDEGLLVEIETVEGDDLDGAAPYVQFLTFGEDGLRAEVVGNAYLEERYALSESEEELLLALGWQPPGEAEGDNFSVTCRLRDADRVAAMAVAALRQGFGCEHPLLLRDDLVDRPVDVVDREPPAAARSLVDEEVFGRVQAPDSPARLHAWVGETLEAMFVQRPEVDGDGDFVVESLRSVVFVRVARDRAAVDLFSIMVTEADDLERLDLEAALLTASHPTAKFVVEGARIVMRRRILTEPFVAQILRVELSEMFEQVDRLAGDLVARVGGSTFRDYFADLDDEDEDDDEGEGDVSALDPHEEFLLELADGPALVGLLELLHDRRVRPASVAALFDYDRTALVAALVGLRTGAVGCAPHDLDLVLSHLRAGLRHTVDRESRADEDARRPLPIPPRDRGRQAPLFPEPETGQGTLDTGVWEQEAS